LEFLKETGEEEEDPFTSQTLPHTHPASGTERQQAENTKKGTLIKELF